MRFVYNKEFLVKVINKMSTKKEISRSSLRGIKRESKRPEPQNNNYVDEESDDEDVIDLCDDHDYQVLSAVFETDKGRNIAEILSRLQKDVHLLAMSVHQLIQLSLASQSIRREESESDESDKDGDYEEDNGSENRDSNE